MNMHGPQFSAAMKLGKDLAGIEKMFVIEGAFDPDLIGEIDFIEHCRHQIAFFDTNTMLTGEHTTNLYAKAQNIGAKRFGAFEFALTIGVIKNDRMQVAVARMKDIRHLQSMAFRQFAHSGQYMRQLLARDRSIHAVIIR